MRQGICVFYIRRETIVSPLERDFSKPYVGFGRERRFESLDVKRGVYYGNSVALLSFQLSCKCHERIEMASSHEREHDNVSFFSSIGHGNNESGNREWEVKEKQRIVVGDWKCSVLFICRVSVRRHKHCFCAKRNGTPINVGHLIQGLINKAHSTVSTFFCVGTMPTYRFNH